MTATEPSAAPEPTPPVHSPGSGFRLVALGLVLVLLTGAIFYFWNDRRPPSADAVLSSAKKFVAKNRSMRFGGTFVVKLKEGEGELGSTETITNRLTGEIARNGAQRAVIDRGDEGANETLLFDKTLYSRSADSVAALTSEAFDKTEIKDIPGVISPEASQIDELNIGSLLAAAHQPKRLSHKNGVTTIDALVDKVKLVGAAAAEEIDAIKVEMQVKKGGEILRVEQQTAGPGAVIVTTLTFKDWGDDVAIATPSADQIDPTPGIKEEKVLAFKDAPLYMPRAIPQGWTFTGADILPEEQTAEGCEQVVLSFEDLNDEENGYLQIFEFPTTCSEPLNGAGIVPFVAGSHSGFAEVGEDGTYAQFDIGKTTIQADTDLTPEDLAQVLDDLIPLKFGAKFVGIPGLGGQRAVA